MKVTEMDDGSNRIDFESGLVVFVWDDGSVQAGEITISNSEFVEIAALRHVMKS